MLSNTPSLEAEKETCGDKFLSLSCLTALLRRLTGQVSPAAVAPPQPPLLPRLTASWCRGCGRSPASCPPWPW